MCVHVPSEWAGLSELRVLRGGGLLGPGVGREGFLGEEGGIWILKSKGNWRR